MIPAGRLRRESLYYTEAVPRETLQCARSSCQSRQSTMTEAYGVKATWSTVERRRVGRMPKPRTWGRQTMASRDSLKVTYHRARRRPSRRRRDTEKRSVTGERPFEMSDNTSSLYHHIVLLARRILCDVMVRHRTAMHQHLIAGGAVYQLVGQQTSFSV